MNNSRLTFKTSMKRIAFKLILILITGLCSLTAEAGPVNAEIEYDPDGKGFYLNFNGSILFTMPYLYNNDFINSGLQSTSYFYQTAPTEGINYIFKTGGNNSEDREMGISRDDTKFLIWQNSENKYIENIEIEWADIKNCAGALTLYIRADKPFDYNGGSGEKKENIIKVYDDVINLFPDPGKKVVYNIPSPAHFIAFLHYEGELSDPRTFNLAAIKSFRIHFVDEEPISKTNINFHIGDIDEESENFDLEWLSEGMKLSTGMSFEGENKGLELKDLDFYLIPEFDIVAKPQATGDKPSDMTEQAWRLYKIFEQVEDAVYDGYITDENPIYCGNALGNSFDSFDIILNPPCAGKYSLMAVSNNPDFLVSGNTLTLNIYPGIKNEYSWLAKYETDGSHEDPIYRFGLNWVNFDSDHNTLYYPHDFYDESKPNSPNKGLLFIPGLYNAEILYKLDFNNSNGGGEGELSPIRGKRNAPTSADEDGFYPYIDENSFNLNDLKDKASMELKIKKNNAVTPLNENTGKSETNFNIQLVDGTFNVQLGVINLESEKDNDIVFYDLNGIRIDSNNLKKGVYIRKTGTRIEKIVL